MGKLDSTPLAQKGVIERKDGRILRRMTVYLDVDLAKKMRVHCANADIDISEMIADAVKKVLKQEKK